MTARLRAFLRGIGGGALTTVLALWAGDGLAEEPAGGLAQLGVLAALMLVIVVPWRASLERPGRLRGGDTLLEALGFVLALAVLGGALLAEPWGHTLGASLYLFILASLSCGLTLSLGRAGQVTATLLGVLWIALPYYATLPLQVLDGPDAMQVVLHSPVPVLCGTFGDMDVLRHGTLYRVFPLGQSFPYSYVAPGAACMLTLLLTAAAWLPLGVRELRSRLGSGGLPAGPAPALVVLVLILFGVPSQAEAQLFPEPTAEENPVGDLVTRVHLGYYLPILEGEFQLGNRATGSGGSKFSYRRHLDLDPQFVVPTFELHMGWANAGRMFIQYMESLWRGETQAGRNFEFEEQILFQGNLVDNRYRFRTIAVGGAMAIPISDFLKFELVTTQRYIKHEVKVRGTPRVFSARNSMEAFVPTIGVGADVLIWNIISAYGDIQWLDFSTSLFGGDDGRYDFRYREWKLGLRLELVEHAHVQIEYYSLETRIKDRVNGIKEIYQTDLNGLRLQVAVLF